MIRQLIPNSKDHAEMDAAKYENDKQHILDDLSKQAANTEKFSAAINPYPICYSETELETERRLQNILSRAIKAIVTNYFSDERIRNIITLDDRALKLLKIASKNPYQIGAYRPDFIYDENGEIVICEINARFCSNAFFITHYLRHCEVEKQINLKDSGAHVQLHVENNVQAFLQRIPESHTVYIVKGREAGWDIHCLAKEFTKLGKNCRVVSPQELGSLVSQKNASFILELHQDEILSAGVYETLSTLAHTGNYFNDLRTIFIAHDKRMLAVMHREDIMRNYLDEADFQFLRAHVAKSYVLSDSEIRYAAGVNKDGWMLKPAQFGKGEGIVLGRTVSQEAWENLLRHADATHDVLQKVVLQPQIPVLTLNGEGLRSHLMNVVGTILCLDEKYLGPGIYRASENDIVNVATGGALLIPILGITH